MKNNTEKTPKEFHPVLAKIEHINDLGKSIWHEVVYYNNGWNSHTGSRTFQDGEQVVEWKYCEDIFKNNDKKLKPLLMGIYMISLVC